MEQMRMDRIRRKHLDLLPATERSEAERTGMGLAELAKRVIEIRGWDAYIDLSAEMRRPPTDPNEVAQMLMDQLRGRLITRGSFTPTAHQTFGSIVVEAYLYSGEKGLWVRYDRLTPFTPLIDEVRGETGQPKVWVPILQRLFELAEDRRIDGRGIEGVSRMNTTPSLLPLPASQVLDLDRGEVRPRTKEDYFTTELSTPYDPHAHSDHLLPLTANANMDNDIFAPYRQMALGQSLIGRNRYGLIFLLTGEGRRTKTCLMKAISILLGPFASYHQYAPFVPSSRRGRPPLQREGDGEIEGRDIRRVVFLDSYDSPRPLAEEFERVTHSTLDGTSTPVIAVKYPHGIDTRGIDKARLIDLTFIRDVPPFEDFTSPSDLSALFAWLVEGALMFRREDGRSRVREVITAGLAGAPYPTPSTSLRSTTPVVGE